MAVRCEQYSGTVAVQNSDNHPDLLGSGPLKATLLTGRFLAELALLAVLVIIGINAGIGLAGRIALAVGLPVVAAVVWGLVMAPRAKRRLADPWRFIAEAVIFAAAAAGLAVTASVPGAVAFGVITIGLAVLARFFAAEG